ncbi:MAG: PfaD family polyunsaturated fatty acid/polyketide biosynthesis protein [Elusimicrobia bacterium]|nr:PfaD family polyunsaturated fatty acid/polyketide biosynthesis protein [Elusimicrobiota bacterium]
MSCTHCPFFYRRPTGRIYIIHQIVENHSTASAPRAETVPFLPYSAETAAQLRDIGRPLAAADRGGGLVLAPGISSSAALIPACPAEHLGDPGFRRTHNLKYAYVGGSMANGISSTQLVEALGRAGMLGFYGAAGQPLEEVEKAIDRVQSPPPFSCGFNLIHSPSEPALETALVDLYLRRGVRLIEASAFIDLTLPLIRFRTSGICRNAAGEIETPNRVIGKISRAEVAARFFSPPEDRFLRELVSRGELTPGQAELASRIPVAEDATAEGDSGGHTDNRPLVNLLPAILALRDRLQERYSYPEALRVGAGGGIATPEAAAAAFIMGAAYIVTGSVNQSCVEAGTSGSVKKILAEAEQADVAMAAAADMFEMGVKVQILKRGTMFAMRANKLYELYRAYNSFEEIPAEMRAVLERDYFRAPLAEIWLGTREYFMRNDPAQAQRAEKDPKHKLALVFRWYLGQASRWPLAGDESRKLDYQVWCGPAMGAFNEWAKGSFLEQPEARDAVTVAQNLLAGAAALTRLHALRCQGIAVDYRLARQEPRTRDQLSRFF